MRIPQTFALRIPRWVRLELWDGNVTAPRWARMVVICCAVAVVIEVDTGQLIGRAIVNLYGVVKSSVRLVETRGMFTCAYKAERI